MSGKCEKHFAARRSEVWYMIIFGSIAVEDTDHWLFIGLALLPAIAGFVAGELAKAALDHGREAYGADISEVRAVVGHEMGHYVLGHSLRIAGSLSLLALVAFLQSLFILAVCTTVIMVVIGSNIARAFTLVPVGRKILNQGSRRALPQVIQLSARSGRNSARASFCPR